MLKKVVANVLSPHREDEIPTVQLNYSKVPMTIEMRKRQYEENMRKKYHLHKNKDGRIL